MATQISNSSVATASATNGLTLQRPLVRRRSTTHSLIQATFDFIAIVASGWQVAATIQVNGKALSLLTVVTALVFTLLAQQAGLYSKYRSLTHKLFTLSRIWVSTLGTVALLCVLVAQTGIPPIMPFVAATGAALLLQSGFHTLHYFARKARVLQTTDVENALIIGEGATANYLQQKIATNPWLEQTVVKRIPLHYGAKGDTSGNNQACSPDLAADNIERLIDIEMIKVVYLVAPSGKSKCFETVYKTLLERQVAIHWIPDVFTLDLINHSVGELAGLPLITLSETPLTGTRLLAKDIEDKVLGSLILLAVSPIMLMIAAAIWLDSPGRVFYRQARGGWNRAPFRIWKFRTMYQCDTDDVAVRQATKNDPRVTRVGAFLRRSSLDELPQLFNVLAGDMSLVGPRPHATSHDSEYSRRISTYMARHHIKPGMTGLAQVRGYRGETTSVEDMQQRIESDLEYINQWSLGLDLSILVRTFGVLKSDKAY